MLESPASLTSTICESVDVSQSLGTTTYSVESNFMISFGETEKRYFQMYPSHHTERGRWLTWARSHWGDSKATKQRFHNRIKAGYTPQEAAEKPPHPGLKLKQYRVGTHKKKLGLTSRIKKILRSII
jgi:hypothetical protein